MGRFDPRVRREPLALRVARRFAPGSGAGRNVRFALGVALVASAFGVGESTFSMVMQYASVILLALLAAVVVSRRPASFVVGDLFSPGNLMLVFAFGILGFVGAITGRNNPPLFYPVLWIVTSVSLLIIVRDIGLRAVMQVYVAACAAYVVLISPMQWRPLLVSLGMIGDLPYWARRFSPFEMHPNLVGHIFASAIILGLVLGIQATTRASRWRYWAMAAVATALVLAAQSRGGLFAAILGSAAAIWMLWRGGHVRNLRVLAVGGAVALGVLLTNGPLTARVGDYISAQLALNSADRGIGSGLSGREGVWPQVLRMVDSDPRAMLFGNGVRSWQPDKEGFDIDDSYINMVYEQGYPMAIGLTAALMGYLLWVVAMAADPMAALVAGILVANLAEAVVTRLLWGVGNPASLLFLAVVLHGFRARVASRERALSV